MRLENLVTVGVGLLSGRFGSANDGVAEVDERGLLVGFDLKMRLI